MLDKKILNKILVPIIEELIDALYESEEDERCLTTDDALDEFDDLLDKYNSEEDWKLIIDFLEAYIDKETVEHDIDITPLKQVLNERINW